ncbi:MAG: macro domain-containing protein [Candidatus Brocadiia bacterium]
MEPPEIRILKGDIAQTMCEAVVNAANNHLWMGAGVAGALKRAAGSEVEREAISKGPIKVGESVATGAGEMSAKYIIHAAVMGQDLATSAQLVFRATRSALTVAEQLGVRSVAFPAFGTGVGGLDGAECAAAMHRAISEWLPSAVNVKEIQLVLYSAELYEAFRQEFFH